MTLREKVIRARCMRHLTVYDMSFRPVHFLRPNWRMMATIDRSRSRVNPVCRRIVEEGARRVNRRTKGPEANSVGLIAPDEILQEGFTGSTSSIFGCCYPIDGPDGPVIASVSDSRTVRLWNAATGEQTRKLEGHNGSVNAVAFSPDGQVVASVPDDRSGYKMRRRESRRRRLPQS